MEGATGREKQDLKRETAGKPLKMYQSSQPAFIFSPVGWKWKRFRVDVQGSSRQDRVESALLFDNKYTWGNKNIKISK